MQQWITIVLIALAIAIFLQIDWAMYLFLVILVGLAIIAQKSEEEVKIEVKEEKKVEKPKKEKKQQQIIVTQPATGSYLDMVYANLITESLLRGKRGLRAWAKKEPPYSTLATGLGDIRYVEDDIKSELSSVKKLLKKIAKKMEADK